MPDNSIAISRDLKETFNALRNQVNTFQADTRARLNMLTVIVVIGILAPYIERAFGG